MKENNMENKMENKMEKDIQIGETFITKGVLNVPTYAYLAMGLKKMLSDFAFKNVNKLIETYDFDSAQKLAENLGRDVRIEIRSSIKIYVEGE
jgi:hypothetical protein